MEPFMERTGQGSEHSPPIDGAHAMFGIVALWRFSDSHR